MTSALHSQYIIDGIAQDLTPAQMLDACLLQANAAGDAAGTAGDGAVKAKAGAAPNADAVGKFAGVKAAAAQGFEPVVDETIDPALKPCVTDEAGLQLYLRQVRAIKSREFPVFFPETYTKFRVATALIDAIWRKGHFRMGDLALILDWSWCQRRIGDMATFYASAQAAADYIDSLGLKINSYTYREIGTVSPFEVAASAASAGPFSATSAQSSAVQHVAASTEAVGPQAAASQLRAEAALAAQPQAGCRPDAEADDDFFGELPWRTEHPQMRSQNAHPSKFLPDPQSWLIYVPFECTDYRLGASCMAQVLGVSGVVAPQIVDPDYFIDCYEVVRELVEDGVVLAGVTVADGGLLPALRRMCPPRTGCTADLSALKAATGENDIVRLLFSEVPGVLFQISDQDYDYVDAELLLQDVAFYPLGHPSPGEPGVRIASSDRSGIQTILESLIRSQSAEGED